MHSTLLVARINPGSQDAVSDLFSQLDATELPHIMGTRRRQLFLYNGLYFHVQDFDNDDNGAAIERSKEHPLFVSISEDLKAHIQAYDPATWRSPKDAMATRFYDWTAAAHGAAARDGAA